MKTAGRFIFIALVVTAMAVPVLAQTKGKPLQRKVPAKKTTGSTAGQRPSAEPWKLVDTKERLVEITTDYGVMIAKLYDSTPLHRDNFVRLVEQKFYDSLLFHRVIPQFMIQGGDPTSKTAPDGAHLGTGSISGDRIPAEFKPFLFHKKGVLAAARDENPAKASSNCQFYIVDGKPMPEPELENIFNQRVKAANPLYNYTATQKEVYRRMGGTPFLDQSYTVFGEVISGLDIIDRIARVAKDESDRPLKNIRMKIRMLN